MPPPLVYFQCLFIVPYTYRFGQLRSQQLRLNMLKKHHLRKKEKARRYAPWTSLRKKKKNPTTQKEHGTTRTSSSLFFLRSEVQYGLPTCPKQHVVCTPHAYPIPRFANNTGFFFFPRDGVEELEERSWGYVHRKQFQFKRERKFILNTKEKF